MHRFSIIKKFSGDESGVSAIEFGILLPFMLGMLIVMADLGTGLMLKMELEGAARTGSQYGLVVKPSTSDLDEIETAALSALPNTGGHFNFRTGANAVASLVCQCSGGSSVACSAACPSGQYREAYLTVTVDRSWQPLVPYPGLPLPMNISSESIVRLQ